MRTFFTSDGSLLIRWTCAWRGDAPRRSESLVRATGGMPPYREESLLLLMPDSRELDVGAWEYAYR